MTDWLKRHATLRTLTFLFSLILFVRLVWYFYTGYGSPSELATLLVPLALILQVLFMSREHYLYPRLPAGLNQLILAVYIGICLYAAGYFYLYYEDVAIWRQGSYNTHDFIVGLMVFLLVMELSRIAHPILFGVNLVLVFYTLFGYLSPIDFFWHPGTTFYRVVTSSTIELATGIYGLYAQLAITLIAAFLLLAAAANGFGAQGAMVMVMRRLAGRSRHTVPQTAVLASVSVGAVSGSGAANTAVTGSFTIPLMMRYGVPAPFAGAVETAASMGGLVMPPLMAVAGFLMAEFLGVPYWDVVLRGFALSFVYFSALALSVYLLSVRLLPPEPVAVPAVPAYDMVKTAIFFLSIGFLIVHMGVIGTGALRAALFTSVFMFALLLAAYLYFKLARGAAAIGAESLLRNLRTMVETHAEMTSYLTLLLATLGIMIGLFTVTGFINRMGGMLLEFGQWHVIALIFMAWIFGWLVGAGLPPTATYIILAIVTVPPMLKVGIDPWVAHFFAFLMAIWGELSPPTSLTAAVASRIADAPFMRTMWEAVKLCLPITFMTFAIFVRSDMVMTPGWPQVIDTGLVAIATWGVTCAIFGRFSDNPGTSVMLRALLALASFVVMLHPDGNVALSVAALVVPGTILAVLRHRRVAPPPHALQPETAGHA